MENDCNDSLFPFTLKVFCAGMCDIISHQQITLTSTIGVSYAHLILLNVHIQYDRVGYMLVLGICLKIIMFKYTVRKFVGSVTDSLRRFSFRYEG